MLPAVEPRLAEGQRLVPSEGGGGDASPDWHASHVGAAPELDVCVQIPRRRASCDGRGHVELARHRHGRWKRQPHGPAAGGVEDDAGDAPRPGTTTGVLEAHGLRCVLSAGHEAERDRRRPGEQERTIGALQCDHASTLESRACGASALVDRIDTRLHERRLQLLHRPRRVALAQERRCAGDVWRRHARPRELGPPSA